ncbi:NADPH:quinone reductase-like Zn-dependent oxidoreductase [Lipingzhangella halophila]|uniref:NADPH:quinone reductase-like Zn-dependent oxidoreductase n=1 Tax=Lipingzhangella halophila TaxID=1783352 RepID=A0A7W7W561_9ACTN|nr:hypothetical protein [Lipingzhangella halophila]MBB4934363.1 NADPH:quinone reductase-like Zn-dependent oxidoreductase [Lipingzhangella halophila]
MLAWTTTPDTPGGLTFAPALDPVPLPHEVLVCVEAIAPNPGDLAGLADAPAGTVPAWDGSGVVLEPAADGTGPTAGERVLFLGLSGGWAQRRAVPRAMTAAAPRTSPSSTSPPFPSPPPAPCVPCGGSAPCSADGS